MKNPQSEAFVKAYEEAYKSVPGTYAMQAYDAALLIDAAIKSAGGKLSDKNAVRAGLKKADFKSLRGNFKMGANGYPIQDFYLVQAVARPDQTLRPNMPFNRTPHGVRPGPRSAQSHGAPHGPGHTPRGAG